MTSRRKTRMLLVIALFAFACDEEENDTSSQTASQKAQPQEQASTSDTPKQDDPAAKGRSRDTFSATLEEMSDTQYPDNPNIGYRSELHGELAYERIRFERREGHRFDLELIPENAHGPEIRIENVDLGVYTPQAPEWLQKDAYLTYVGLINQEWNRQQIHFRERAQVLSTDPKWKRITRVDVARNCLNAKLWEVIAYRDEDGSEKPVYHGWFDFPEPLYAALFEDANGVPWKKFEKPLEHWIDPENKQVDLGVLRQVEKEHELQARNLNEELYSLTGARKKKYKNIIQPAKPKSIQAMLDDSTTFATFDKPGFYNKSHPRETRLGRLAKLQSARLRTVRPTATDERRHEIELTFDDAQGERHTRLVISGLDLEAIPRLDPSEHDAGYKMPMGIANHSFYEAYDQAQSRPVSDNPYFGMLLDGSGKWLDSHHVGIDGPLLHWDAKKKNVLHFYILAFERHAYVGHYALRLPSGSDA